MAERSKARVCGLSFAGIAGSNPATGMDVSLMQEFDYVSRGVIPTVVCQCVWSINLKNEAALAREGLLRHRKEEDT